MLERKKNIWIHGLSGRMGQEIFLAVKKDSSYTFLGGSSRSKDLSVDKLNNCDLIFDFTNLEGNLFLLETLKLKMKASPKVLIGTTGLTTSLINGWRELQKERLESKIFLAPNTSVGILLLLKSSLMIHPVLANLGFDLEIEETHHRKKSDSPSGTASYLAKKLAEKNADTIVKNRETGRTPGEIGVHSIRGGNIPGEHRLRFLGANEELTLTHRSYSRSLFASGALKLGHWLLKKEPGYYTLDDVNPMEIVSS